MVGELAQTRDDFEPELEVEPPELCRARPHQGSAYVDGYVLSPERLIGWARHLPGPTKRRSYSSSKLQGLLEAPGRLHGLALRIRRYEAVQLCRQVSGFRPPLDFFGDRPAPEVAQQIDGRDDRLGRRPLPEAIPSTVLVPAPAPSPAPL